MSCIWHTSISKLHHFLFLYYIVLKQSMLLLLVISVFWHHSEGIPFVCLLLKISLECLRIFPWDVTMLTWRQCWNGGVWWHASTQPAVGAAKHHSQNAYLTAMFGQYIGAILTTKYGFNLRQNSPLNIENNTGYSGWIRVSVAHGLIGPQSLKLAHFWSDTRWFPPLLFHYIPLHDWKRAGETVLNATVPTSPPGDHSRVESPARGYCVKNSAYVNKAG